MSFTITTLALTRRAVIRLALDQTDPCDTKHGRDH